MNPRIVTLNCPLHGPIEFHIDDIVPIEDRVIRCPEQLATDGFTDRCSWPLARLTPLS